MLDQRLGRLAGVVDAAEHDHQPVALHGAQRVHPAGPGRAAYLVEESGLGALGRARCPGPPRPGPGRPSRARWPGSGPSRRPRRAARRRRPAPRAGRPRRRAPRRPGRRPRRWRTRPRGRSAGSRACTSRRVLGVEQLVDVVLDDLDREPDQVDGLLEADDAGQGAGGRAEHRGRHL